jgi:hypothetical protein
MKRFYLLLVFCAELFLHSCGESPVDSRYSVELPQIPRGWETLLGSPYWRIEWLNDQGRKETKIVRGNSGPEIFLPPTLASAVSAFPFWPDRGIGPNIFRPAGAIFPFDASGKTLVLSWQGGVDANLFWELAQAYQGAQEETVPPAAQTVEQHAISWRAVLRLPWNFNWPRFRRLFDDPGLNAEIRADPWLADWHSIAEKIVKSGFDKRRLVPEARSSLEVPVHCGPWVGTSPFAPPLFFETTPVFSVRSSPDTWVSAEGILRCTAQTWILLP